jgi:GT2 family glycosyltransferase
MMAGKPIRVEIVAPVHNRREITLQCLRSLSRLETAGLNVHTVIVDDGSTDGTGEAIRQQFPEVEVVQGDGTLWFTEGTNVGVRTALRHEPKYILTINDDAVFDPAFLRSMVSTAERFPRSVIGSLLLLWDQPHRLFQTAPVWDTWSGGWRQWHAQTIWTIPLQPFEVDAIVGNCVLFPVEAIREAGLMDSKHYPNFGDAEYTPRMKRMGWRLVIDPGARVFCQPNTLPAKITKSSLRDKVRMLFTDLGHPHNLRRRFRALWETAPSKHDAIIAYGIFFLRLLVGKNTEGKWGQKAPEPPLSETFRDRVLCETEQTAKA